MLLKILSKFRKEVSLLALLSLVAAILETLGIAILAPILPVLLGEEGGGGGNLSQIKSIVGSNINFILILIPILFLFKNALLIALKYLNNKIIFKIKSQLEIYLLEKFLSKDHKTVVNGDSANVSNNILHEVQILTFNVFQALIVVLTELFLVILIFIGLMIYNAALLFLIIMPALIIGYLVYKLAARLQIRWGEDNKSASKDLYSLLEICIGAFKEIKIYSVDNYFLKKFSVGAKNLAESYAKSQTLSMASFPILETITIGLLFGGLYYLISIAEFNGPELAEVLSIYGVVAVRILPSFSRIAMSMNQIKFGNRAILALGKELFGEPFAMEFDASRSLKEPFPTYDSFKSLELIEVSFSYGDNSKLLERVNLSVTPGKLIGIFGESGSGKTTLINIVVGLAVPSAGKILLNSKNVLDFDSHTIKMIFGYVPQDVYVTDSTLAENIAFGVSLELIDLEYVKDLCVRLKLMPLLKDESCPSKVKLSSRGGSMSGGQRARLGVARALYRRPKILVLDEVTSSLDSATEQSLIEEIVFAREKDVSIILISHKIHNFNGFNEVFEVCGGRLRQVVSDAKAQK